MIWHDQVLELDAALSAHNIQRVEMLARANRADFAVVQWDEPSGVYDDGNFSVIATK
jgi:alpha-D-ribose 1-methylphosphonate 5-triphosphate synthase subunit PhnL